MNRPVEKFFQLSPLNSPFACAFATALLLWLPAQKWGLFPLAWFALAPLLWAARDMDAKQRRRYGWRAGFLFFALANWWIVPTVVYGAPMIGASPLLGFFLGVIAVAFIASVHGCQFLVALWLWDEKRWARRLWLMPIVVALAWAAFDWLRCIGPLAHIWGAVAFTQWRDVWLLQLAPFVGQHGITFIVVWCGAMLALWLQTRRAICWAAPLVLMSLAHFYGAFEVLREPVYSRGRNVFLISTNVPSLRKSGLGAGESSFDAAWRQTLNPGKYSNQLVPWGIGPELFVWPETTIEFEEIGGRILQRGERVGQLASVKQKLQSSSVSLLTGATHREVTETGEKLFNTALLLAPDPAIAPQTAPKIRTVPMGEKAPFGEYIPFLKRFAPNPEVTPGTEPKILNHMYLPPIGTVICFESCFPEPARSLKKQGARVLFILTNDEYFKGTNAPWEHAAMAVMRAAENRLPVAQVANGGYTLLVDSRGRILHQSFGEGATPVNIPLD
jgi:apolipoprotein N-acyltransferase